MHVVGPSEFIHCGTTAKTRVDSVKGMYIVRLGKCGVP